VLIFAHRGRSLEYPENTALAIASAFDAGADAVEVDIRLSKDGIPVVFHDDVLERTTNGAGRPADFTVAELKRLDAGRWRGPRFAGARIVTLEEAIRLAKGRGPLLLDLKVDGMAEAVRWAYLRAGADPCSAFIGGWSEVQRADFAAHLPCARILRTERAPRVWNAGFYADQRARRIWGFELGDEWPAAFIADATLHGLPVIAYTVNDEPTMRRLIEMGVAGIETDDPVLLRTLLDTLPGSHRLPARLNTD
jgi:glycerophosphoryl diester phosphodiesterase